MTEKEKAVKCLRTLRNLLTDDEDLKIPIHDEKFLIRFVRGKKYDVEAAHETVRKYYTLRKKNPKIFRIAYPSNKPVRELLEKNAVTKLKHNDAEGRAVVVCNIPKWDTATHNLDHMLAAVVLVIEELLLFSVEVQINGIVILVNYDGLSMSHVTQFTPGRVKSALQILQGSYPLRLKQIHIIKEPSIFEIIYSMMKPFMTAKLKERLVLHGQKLEKYFELFPPENLPEDHGGKLSDDEAYDQKFKEELFQRDSYYQELLDYGFGEWDSDEEDTYM